jgi:hypothetical protein
MLFKRKFSWIDLAVIVILVAAVAGISYKFAKANVSKTTEDKQKLIITFRVENTPDTNVTAIKEGDPVTETVQGASLGKVVDIKAGPSVYWESGKDGQLVSSSREGYSSLDLTMEVYGILKSNGIFIDKTSYYVGQTIGVYAGCSLINTGRISSVSLAE